MTSWKSFNSYEIFYDSTRKRWPFNTGDCLIEVPTWAGLTVVYIVFFVSVKQDSVKITQIAFIDSRKSSTVSYFLKWKILHDNLMLVINLKFTNGINFINKFPETNLQAKCCNNKHHVIINYYKSIIFCSIHKRIHIQVCK
jgi:hypothetical protein